MFSWTKSRNQQQESRSLHMQQRLIKGFCTGYVTLSMILSMERRAASHTQQVTRQMYHHDVTCTVSCTTALGCRRYLLCLKAQSVVCELWSSELDKTTSSSVQMPKLFEESKGITLKLWWIRLKLFTEIYDVINRANLDGIVFIQV